jgi:hypothetical protein
MKRSYMRTTRPKSGSRKDLKAELDRLTSLIVRARDRYCVLCGTAYELTCSHYYTRGNPELRFDLLNCHAMCKGCNCQHGINTEPYTSWMIRTYGHEALDSLNQRRIETEKLTDEDLKEKVKEYKSLLEILKSEMECAA